MQPIPFTPAFILASMLAAAANAKTAPAQTFHAVATQKLVL
jgi:hypothetical protein